MEGKKEDEGGEVVPSGSVSDGTEGGLWISCEDDAEGTPCVVWCRDFLLFGFGRVESLAFRADSEEPALEFFFFPTGLLYPLILTLNRDKKGFSGCSCSISGWPPSSSLILVHLVGGVKILIFFLFLLPKLLRLKKLKNAFVGASNFVGWPQIPRFN